MSTGEFKVQYIVIQGYRFVRGYDFDDISIRLPSAEDPHYYILMSKEGAEAPYMKIVGCGQFFVVYERG